MSEQQPYNRNPVPKEDERELDKVIIQVQQPGKESGKRKPSEEETNVSPRIVELRRQLAEREKTRAIEAGKEEMRRKKLQRIIGGTVTAIAAAAGVTLFVTRNSEGKNDPAKKNPPALTAGHKEPEHGSPAPTATVMVTTAPTGLSTTEPNIDVPEPVIAGDETGADNPETTASSTPTAKPGARAPYPNRKNDSFYDEIENESIYDTLDRKYPSKKPAPQPKNSGSIIRKAPF